MSDEDSHRSTAPTDDELDLQSRQIDVRGQETDLALRKRVANGALAMMVAEIVFANVVFVIYGDTNGWDIPTVAITGWLAATVVQVISVVLVITRYLFPNNEA